VFNFGISNYSLVIAAGIFVTSLTAAAVEIKPQASLAMQTNTRTMAGQEQEDLIRTTGLAVSVDGDGKSFQLDADASVKKKEYLSGIYEGKEYDDFALNAVANWVIIKDQLTWILKDFYTQQIINSLIPETPDNIRDTNVLTFGPLFNYQITGRQRLSLKPEYREYRYDAYDIDNKQGALDVSWNYQPAERANIGFRGELNKIEYENSALINNEFRSIYLTLSKASAVYNFSVDAGTTRVDREGMNSVYGASGNIKWLYNITSDTFFRIYVASNLTDTNNSLLNSSINPDDGNFSNEQASSDYMRKRNFTLVYQTMNSGLRSRFWAEIRRQDFGVALMDQNIDEFGVEFNYPIANLMTAGINMRHGEVESLNIDRMDDQSRVGGNINYHFSRRLRGVLEFKKYKNDSTIDTADFTEKTIFLSFVYGYGI